MTFTKSDEIKDVCGINTTICIDEVRMKYVTPEDLLNIETKAKWIVIRDTRTENPEEYLRTHFPDWDIAKLNYPQRTSKTYLKKSKGVMLHLVFTIIVLMHLFKWPLTCHLDPILYSFLAQWAHTTPESTILLVKWAYACQP